MIKRVRNNEKKMFFVYVIRSTVNGHFYVGITEDVKARLVRHNRGDNRSTETHRPWELFFFESYNTRIGARKREVYLKSGIGKEYIKRKWSERVDIEIFDPAAGPGSSAG